MKISQMLKKIIFKEKYNSDTYIKYLKNLGVRIGEGTIFYDVRSNLIDLTRPWLIEIGSNVQFTKGCSILTHGYDWSVLKGKYGKVLGSSGKVKIGDNVFIGVNTVILKGVNIGNNVIIGANSLVNKNVPDNVVVAGNPAKVITTIDEYLKKRENNQISEAQELVREYYKVYKKIPPKEILREFFWLFEDRDSKEFSNKAYEDIMHLVGNYDYSVNVFKNSQKKFENYEEFIKSCNLE